MTFSPRAEIFGRFRICFSTFAAAAAKFKFNVAVFKSFFCGRDSGRKKMQETNATERRKKAFFCGPEGATKKCKKQTDTERRTTDTERRTTDTERRTTDTDRPEKPFGTDFW